MLTAVNLTRAYGERVAVQDVSFELVRGEIFALLGPNGAGKTTTLRMLAGLITPSSGTIRIDGTTLAPSTAAALRQHIGFLTEAPGLWDRLTVRQNLRIYAGLFGLDRARRRIEVSLDALGLRDRAEDRTAELSKGLKQRVAIARCLLHNPDILLLDEPTSGLDPESARDVRQIVQRFRDERRAVLLSTHNLDEVERLADQVAVLRTRLVASGRPSVLRERLFEPRVRIGLSGPAGALAPVVEAAGGHDVRVDGSTLSFGLHPGATTPAVVRALVQAGAAIESVGRDEPPLEDVYLRILQEDGAP